MSSTNADVVMDPLEAAPARDGWARVLFEPRGRLYFEYDTPPVTTSTIESYALDKLKVVFCVTVSLSLAAALIGLVVLGVVRTGTTLAGILVIAGLLVGIGGVLFSFFAFPPRRDITIFAGGPADGEAPGTAEPILVHLQERLMRRRAVYRTDVFDALGERLGHIEVREVMGGMSRGVNVFDAAGSQIMSAAQEGRLRTGLTRSLFMVVMGVLHIPPDWIPLPTSWKHSMYRDTVRVWRIQTSTEPAQPCGQLECPFDPVGMHQLQYRAELPPMYKLAVLCAALCISARPG